VVATRSDRLYYLSRLLQVSPGRRYISCVQRMTTGVVVQLAVDQPVAGSFGTGDGLGEQLCVASGVAGVTEQQIPHEAPTQQDVVAKLPGTLHSLLAEGQSPVRLAGVIASDAECGERLSDQPVVAELAS
jgi:hypothetical protein